MRFSELPLSRRVLIFVVTALVVGAIYWVIAAFVAVTPLWLDALVLAAMLGFAFFAIRYDNRVRRLLEARRDGQPLLGEEPKTRRGKARPGRERP